MLSDDYGYLARELRVLPSGGDSNTLCSRRGFEDEIAWRRERNKELGANFQFKIPDWDDLEVYDKEE